MKRQAFDDLRSAIHAHSERKSIDDLAAQGKRHVRVVSGTKVLNLIQAIVDDAIKREALELAEQDRDRIVGETRKQFDRALRIQGEQEERTREQRDRADRLESELLTARRTIATLETELAAEQAKLAALRSAHAELTQRREDDLTRVSDTNAERISELERNVATAEKERLRAKEVAEGALERSQTDLEKARQLEGRLATARATIENYDSEFELLNAQLADERRRADSRATEAVSELRAQLDAAREKADALEREREQRAKFEGNRIADLERQLVTAAEQRAATDRERDQREQSGTARITELERRLAEALEQRTALEREHGELEQSATARAADLERQLAAALEVQASMERERGEREQSGSARIADLERQLAAALELRAGMERELAAGQAELAALKSEQTRLQRIVDEEQQQLSMAAEELARLEGHLEQEKTRIAALEARAAGADAGVQAKDREIAGLQKDLASAVLVLEQARNEIANRDAQLAATRQAEQAADVDALRADLNDMKSMLSSLTERKPGMDEAALQQILSRIDAGEALRTDEFEDRFSTQLDRALGEVTRSIKLATAGPIDVSVEATDVLVDRLFDQDSEMSTNLGALAVEETKDRRGIAGDLDRLRKARTRHQEIAT